MGDSLKIKITVAASVRDQNIRWTESEESTMHYQKFNVFLSK